jgi:hypothetical protein
MRAVTICSIACALVACGRPAEQPVDTADVSALVMEEAPAGISLADVAGTWSVRGTARGKEGPAMTYDMVTTADRAGWFIKFPDRDPIPVRVVAVEGDSIVTEAGPFESVLRKGVQVSTRVVSRLQGEKLVGTTTARYQVGGPDTVATIDFEGTRKE